jgi:hypothetical protein
MGNWGSYRTREGEANIRRWRGRSRRSITAAATVDWSLFAGINGCTFSALPAFEFMLMYIHINSSPGALHHTSYSGRITWSSYFYWLGCLYLYLCCGYSSPPPSTLSYNHRCVHKVFILFWSNDEGKILKAYIALGDYGFILNCRAAISTTSSIYCE